MIYEKEVIQDIVTAGVSGALTALGLSTGEISQRQAYEVYGRWLRDAVRDGRIKPVRYGGTTTSTKWYSVAEILALRVADRANADVLFERVKTKNSEGAAAHDYD